jgi:hypothetical protein
MNDFSDITHRPIFLYLEQRFGDWTRASSYLQRPFKLRRKD